MRRMLCAALALMLLLTACVQTETPPAELSGAASDADETAEPEYPVEETPLRPATTQLKLCGRF